MPLRLYTAPSLEPVTLQEAKDHLRYEEQEDDQLIRRQLIAARQWAEKVCWRGFVSQVWELTLPGFRGADRFELAPRYPQSVFPIQGSEWIGALGAAYRFMPYLELPGGGLDPITPIAAFSYVDPNGVTQTLSSSVYSVDFVTEPGRVHLAYGQAWPQTREQWNAVVIRYNVGWAVADVPEPIKQAILLQLSAMYEARSPVALEGNTTIDALLAPYRLIRIG